MSLAATVIVERVRGAMRHEPALLGHTLSQGDVYRGIYQPNSPRRA